MRSRWKRTPSISTSTPPPCWRWQAAAFFPPAIEYLSQREPRRNTLRGAERLRLCQRQGRRWKNCVSPSTRPPGAMEALRRALHALDTAHLGEKARADACRALREHEMAALREAADELEELVPQDVLAHAGLLRAAVRPVRPAAHGFCVQKSYCKRKTAPFRAAASRGTGPFPYSAGCPCSTRRSAKPQPPPGIFRKPSFSCKSPPCLRPQ